MNSDIPIRLTDFATALPPAELRGTCEFRRSVLFPTAITCGVAAGVFSLASLIYGTYRVSVALDWNYILVPILSGCFLHPVLSVGAGGLGYLAVWKLGNRLLVDKTSQLEGQIEEWRTQLHTAVNEIHLRTVTQLATSDQLGRLMKSMNLPQQLMLRQLVGARTFESCVVPASGDRVRPYWSALHALTKPITDIAALLAN